MCKSPSIGRWRFVQLVNRADRHYQAALARLRDQDSAEMLLDLGCGVGQVLRQFVHDGVEPSRLYGVEMLEPLIEIGYRLFRDRALLQDRFAVGDVLECDHDPAVGGCLDRLRGQITLVHASRFWHLFGWAQQLALARRIVRDFLRPDPCPRSPAIIFGCQIGSLEPGERYGLRSCVYLHDQASLQRLWDQVGQGTRTSWTVVVDQDPRQLEGIPGLGKKARAIRYAIYQILP